MTLKCSVGVLAHNEAANMPRLLAALLSQELKQVEIAEIIVISSASTDGTDDIVRDFMADYPQVKLITEDKRRGKSAAINKFIKAATSDILVMESGDTLPEPDTVEKLVCPFADPKVGMVGGRPVPENPNTTFVGYTVNLLWRLHHHLALISPKLGEMVAFRKIFEAIPTNSAVDEASMEALIRAAHLKLQYVPKAIIHNKGPENLPELITQRRRIAAGHCWLKQKQHYTVSSSQPGLLWRITADEILRRPGRIPMLVGAALLETMCRLLGRFDYHVLRKNPYAWKMVPSTKKLRYKG